MTEREGHESPVDAPLSQGASVPLARSAERARRLVPVAFERRHESVVDVITSLKRGRRPPQGVLEPKYTWYDVLDGSPPAKRERGQGAYALYHGTEVSEEVRLSYSTVVQVDPGVDSASLHDDLIHIDARISVQKRTLLEFMDAERAFTDRVTNSWRTYLGKRLVAQRQTANKLPAFMKKGAIKAIKLEAKVMNAVIDGTKNVNRAIVQVPDALVSRMLRAQAHLEGRIGRKSLTEGLRNPATLSNEQKGVVLFLSTMILVTFLILLNSVFALLLTDQAAAYKRFVADAAVSMLSVLGLPLPSEPLVIRTTIDYGPLLAFCASVSGKMVGVWLLYFIGDSLYDQVNAATKGRPRLAGFIAFLNRNAEVHGFWVLILVNSIPLVPDILLVVFAISGMHFKKYFAGIGIGTAIKTAGICSAVLILGEERVLGFFSNPFG